MGIAKSAADFDKGIRFKVVAIENERKKTSKLIPSIALPSMGWRQQSIKYCPTIQGAMFIVRLIPHGGSIPGRFTVNAQNRYLV
jgi:hypothetical protein